MKHVVVVFNPADITGLVTLIYSGLKPSQVENLVYADIFETANSGVLISDFLRFGKIPVVEHYGGHMLSSVIGGILYGIVNQDYSGAAYTMYYLAAPIVAFLFYKFMQAHTSRETALLTTLFFPYDLLWSYFGMAAAAVLLLVYYLKGPNWKRALVLWGTVAGLCLYTPGIKVRSSPH